MRDLSAGKMTELFWTFFRIGAFTFGGGYAMLPLIQRETVEEKRWISEGEILEVVAIAETTPGPIAVNAATFIGYRVAGVPGAVLATCGVVLPSFLIMLLAAFILGHFWEVRAVRYAFFGIRAGVLALIAKALVNMYQQCPKSPASYVVMFGAFAAAAFLKAPVIGIILACAVAGIVLSALTKRKGAA